MEPSSTSSASYAVTLGQEPNKAGQTVALQSLPSVNAFNPAVMPLPLLSWNPEISRQQRS